MSELTGQSAFEVHRGENEAQCPPCADITDPSF